MSLICTASSITARYTINFWLDYWVFHQWLQLHRLWCKVDVANGADQRYVGLLMLNAHARLLHQSRLRLGLVHNAIILSVRNCIRYVAYNPAHKIIFLIQYSSLTWYVICLQFRISTRRWCLWFHAKRLPIVRSRMAFVPAATVAASRAISFSQDSAVSCLFFYLWTKWVLFRRVLFNSTYL